MRASLSFDRNKLTLDHERIVALFLNEGLDTEQVIERFLKRMDIDTPDAYGETPLHKAVKFGNVLAKTYLISKGAKRISST